MKHYFTLLPVALVGSSLSAATLSGSFDDYSPGTRGDADFNLTALGNVDWAYWDTSVGTGASGSPANSKLSGSVIGDISPVGGGGLRGTSTGGAQFDFTYTDGVSGPAGSIEDPTGLFNTEIGFDGQGQGVGLNFVLPDAGVTYEIRVWVAGFNVAEGLFTASLTGASDYSDSSFTAGSSTSRDSALYLLQATPDADDDILNVAFTLASPTGGSAHTLIGGAAVSAVPEPAAAGLLVGLVVVACAGARRRLR